MTTLTLEDCSTELLARIAEARARREASGITPLEKRIGSSTGLRVRFHPDIPAEQVQAACDAHGWVIVNHGGEYLVKPI